MPIDIRDGMVRLAGSEPLSSLAAEVGETVPSAGNKPVTLDDPGVAWFVQRGALDIFIAEHAGGEVASAFEHAVRIGPGRWAYGVTESDFDNPLRLIGKGLPGTVLLRVPLRGLLENAATHLEANSAACALINAVDAWIEDLGAAVSREIKPRPRIDYRLPPNGHLKVEGELTAERGVVWASSAETMAFLGSENASRDRSGWTAVTPLTWITAIGPVEINCTTSENLGLEKLLFEALPEFHRLCLGAEGFNRQLALADVANLQSATSSHRGHQRTAAEQNLLNLSKGPGRPPVDVPPLLGALQAVGRHEGISFQGRADEASRDPSLRDILEMSRVRARKVRLERRDRWWLGDSGAMLAFRRDDGQPVALLPAATGGYRIQDPLTGKSTRVRAENIGELDDFAWFPYRPIHHDDSGELMSFFRIARGQLWGDLMRLAVAGATAGLLSLTPAVAIGMLIESVVPFGDAAELLRFTVVLVILAFATGLLHMLRGMALMRLEGRISTRLSAALWDRLFSLPVGFFRRFSAGDVAERATALMVLRDRTAGTTTQAALSMLFALPAIGLLFFYNVALGWLNLAVGVGVLAATAAFGIAQLEPQRQFFAASRRVSGDLLQLINGIGKLRTAQAEDAALAFWAFQYRKKKQAEIRIAAISEHLASFAVAVPALASALVFAVALTQESLELAEFLTIYAASIVLYSSLVSLGLSFQGISAIVPGCEQVLPILAAETEAVSRDCKPITLGGEIRFDQVNFRYTVDGPQILHNVSFHANPGELVAVVGESGAGKSTLIQLALGLESPVTGGVYYDGRNLKDLDVASVRRQVGVVVQDGVLLVGDVRSNIIGEAPDLSLDDAWRAARQAAVADDIAAMPMGLYTPVGETAATFSGGQIQRIRIAAALVRNPRILFLDEATSWLDTHSQAETMAGIRATVATRIVIAHRLTTIQEADRIYVMQAGRIVQQGNYEQLIRADGVFRGLALRQMA